MTCVDFSKAQLEQLFKAQKEGQPIEFESYSPYLADYNSETGEIDPDCLVQADTVGLAISKVVQGFLPNARMVSLYDDYNVSTEPSPSHTSTCAHMQVMEDKYENEDLVPHEYTPEVRAKFKEEVKRIVGLQGFEGLPQGEENEKYLFVSEGQKVLDVEVLVPLLEAEGRGAGVNYIERDGEKITFVNEQAENPKFKKVTLRTKNGRWLCAALDAAAYVKRENLFLQHLIILSDEYKDQQDKVWEILRVLGIKSTNYHNIYYSLDPACGDVAEQIRIELSKFA